MAPPPGVVLVWQAVSVYQRRALQVPQCQVPFYTHLPGYEHPVGLEGVFQQSDVSEHSLGFD